MPLILHLTVARKIIVLVQIYDKIERVWLRLSIELLCGAQKLRADAFQRPLLFTCAKEYDHSAATLHPASKDSTNEQ